MQGFYLFGSRIATHIGFWLLYYLTFGFIWAQNGNYWESYYLEFVLLPTRILAVYFTLYVLIPKFLKPKKLWSLVGAYLVLIGCAAILQRVFTFHFFEGLLGNLHEFWFLEGILKNIILINSTILFVSALKITQLWWQEGDRSLKLETLLHALNSSNSIVEIKAEKRIYRMPADDILFVEGMGNYVIFHTINKKLISYTSLKQALDKLPSQFQRIHKSYLVNSDKVTSYDQENVEINGNILPLGRSYKDELALN